VRVLFDLVFRALGIRIQKRLHFGACLNFLHQSSRGIPTFNWRHLFGNLFAGLLRFVCSRSCLHKDVHSVEDCVEPCLEELHLVAFVIVLCIEDVQNNYRIVHDVSFLQNLKSLLTKRYHISKSGLRQKEPRNLILDLVLGDQAQERDVSRVQGLVVQSVADCIRVVGEGFYH
jgi:hypothetical protein